MAEKVDTTYQLRQGESIPDYNARIAAYRGEGSGAPVKTDVAEDPFIAELKKSLSSAQGAISSADSGIEEAITRSMDAVERGRAANEARVTSQYDRLKGYQQETNMTAETALLESRSGFATPVVAFKNLRDYNEKSLRDLEQRKQELILMGDSEAAGKISTLELQALQFEQEAAKNTFNTLLSLGNFALTERAQKVGEEQFNRTMSFQENSAISEIALQYGIQVRPGDTIDTITSRAAPFASEEQRLQLEEMRSSINRNNADTQRIISESAGGDVSIEEIDALAMAALSPNGGSAVLAGIKNPEKQAAVINRMDEMQTTQFKESAEADRASGLSKTRSQADVAANDSLTPAEKAKALKAIEEVYGATTQSTNTGFSFESFITGAPKDTRGAQVQKIYSEIARLEKLGTFAAREKIKKLRYEASLIR